MSLNNKIQVEYELDDSRWSFYDFEGLSRLICKIFEQIFKIDPMVEEYIDALERLNIGVICTNNQSIQALNAKFRHKDKPTNVLSFPTSDYYDAKTSDHKCVLTSPVQNLGDIVLAYETIKEEAFIQQKFLQNHFTHLLVHSILHLLGYDHMDDQSAEKMEKIEICILRAFKIQNPYNDIKSRDLFRAADE